MPCSMATVEAPPNGSSKYSPSETRELALPRVSQAPALDPEGDIPRPKTLTRTPTGSFGYKGGGGVRRTAGKSVLGDAVELDDRSGNNEINELDAAFDQGIARLSAISVLNQPRKVFTRAILDSKATSSRHANGAVGCMLSMLPCRHRSTLRRTTPACLLDPRTDDFVSMWDTLTGLALVFTATVTPYEVGFVQPATMWTEPLFLFNRVIDAIFIVDLVLQFFIVYHGNETASQPSRWVTQRGKIACHYLKTWFALDVLSVGVSAIDFFSLCGKPTCDQSTDSEALSSLKVLRTLRALRLIKLARLLKASRMIKRWEMRLAVNYAALEMSAAIIGVLLLAHLFACIWGLQCSFATSLMSSWVGMSGYCIEVNTSSTAFHPLDMHMDLSGEFPEIWPNEGLACKRPATIYFASLYWAVMTITSIGYGDIAATPANELEQIIATLLMLIGSFLWAKVMAVFVHAADRDVDDREFKMMLDQLNSFMASQHLPSEMRQRLREYFHHTKHLRATQRRQELLQMMSSQLQAEVAWTVNHKWLQAIFFLRSASSSFMVELALRLEPLVFAPSEMCPPGLLYIVSRGLALFEGRVLAQGKVWGEDVILSSIHLRSKHCARALTFLEVLTIDRDVLNEIAAPFPKTANSIRRAAIRLATRRQFIHEARFRIKQLAPVAPLTPQWDKMFCRATSSKHHSYVGNAPSEDPTSAKAVRNRMVTDSVTSESSVAVEGMTPAVPRAGCCGHVSHECASSCTTTSYPLAVKGRFPPRRAECHSADWTSAAQEAGAPDSSEEPLRAQSSAAGVAVLGASGVQDEADREARADVQQLRSDVRTLSQFSQQQTAILNRLLEEMATVRSACDTFTTGRSPKPTSDAAM